ncbi:hypothetical protein [Streptomyces sp. Ag109_O5-10]|uniref:hypothetical protein n=1 Tax=Streptomyces sp. Ag109_O5-10 TaxID=1855349 RepID=UPI0015A51103
MAGHHERRPSGHPLPAGEPTPERYATAAGHLNVSRRGKLHGPVDAAPAELALERRVVGSGGTFPASLLVLRESGLIGPAWHFRHDATRRTPGCGTAYGSR